MKIYAPEYVKNFKCIADRCRHSCCVGWEIDIDDKTLGLYRAMPDKRIMSTVEDGEPCHFRLGSDRRCENLTDAGLCRIICEHGESYIPEICREHPRFYNRSSRGLEMGIGMSCEEACRIILSSSEYRILHCADENTDCGEPKDFDASAKIERIYEILSKRDIPYSKRLEKISELCGIKESILRNSALWSEVFSSLEYLDNSHRSLFQKYDFVENVRDAYAELSERAFAYFIYRHASGADSPYDFKSRITLSFLFERLYTTLLSLEDDSTTKAYEYARVISEEIEYSEENTDTLLSEISFLI